ncbi:mucin-5AC-like [Eleutherodactylus coqui]|uniref:mucin-5AC-like n=1 Tax=Eleutherodactylus coqui TaxID=57060 RepID=UPI003461958A
MPCCVVRGCVYRWKKDDSYHYDGYRRILRKDAVPTIFNTENQSAVPSIPVVPTDIPSVSKSLNSSSKRHIPSAPPAVSKKPSDSSSVRTSRVELPVRPKLFSQSTIQRMTLVPVVPQHVLFQAIGIGQKSNSVVSDRSVTIQPTATTTMCKTMQMQSVLSVVSPQSSVLSPSTSSILEGPVSLSSSCVQQDTSAISGFKALSHSRQLKPITSANLQQSTAASVTLLQNSSSPVLTNSNLPLDTHLRLETTSSSTKTLSSTTSTCPIISLSPAATPVISTSGTDKPPYKTLCASPVSIPLTVVSEKKPCSMTVLPVSGNVSSVTQTSPITSGLLQKLPSLSVVRMPLKTPTSQTASPDCLPPSKKRKLEENIVFLERSTPSSSNPSILPSPCTNQTSINTGKFYFVPSSAPLIQPSSLIQKPLMVDKGVNTDFLTNRKSCCISTDHFYRRRNAQTQTKIHRKHRKIMCTLLLPGELTDSESTVSLASPEHIGFSDCSPSRSSDDGYDPHEVLETSHLDLVKVEILSDSEMDVPTINKKQAMHIKEEYESSARQAALSPGPLQHTSTIPDIDTSSLKTELNIKTEEDQFPISPFSENLTQFLPQNPKIERISPIKCESLASICRNPISWETSAVQTDDEPEDLNDFSFYSNDLSEDEDESFLLPSDAEDEDDIKPVFQDLDSPVENPVEEEKYIVFESCLRKLIMMIPCMSKTKCMSPLTQYRKETTGSHLSIEVRCSSGHTSLLWESQPRHGYQPLGNVLLSAAVLFSGSSFLKSQHMFKLLNLKSIDKTTHHKNQYMYLYPAISHHWKEEQKGVIRGAKERPLCLAGDQQLDKPGYLAKYSIYSLMDVTSKKICSFSVEPVNPQVTLDCLEKTGFQKAMDELQTMNVDVKMIVTDRSVAIQEVLKDNYPNILHRLDLWHLSKSIGNEVLMAAKHKDCEILYQWVETIRNHIWWSSHTCCRNPDLLIQKWKSVIHHVSNVHEWDGDSDCKACPHPPLPEDVVSSTNWLQKDSTAYEQLKKIVENTSLLSDLKQLSFSCHTGELEIYHGTCLKYCPKTSNFFMDSMVARTQLAALDHNRNVHKVKAVVQNASSGDDLGTMTHRLKSCKGQRSWITKALYKPTYQNFLFDIMNDIIAFIREEKTFN